MGGICWLSVDNPAQSPRIPVFCGTSKLPDAFLKCGQNKWDEDAVVWKFRPANKLATLAWQSTKKGFMENVLAIEDTAFEGLPDLESAPATALDGYTAAIFNQAAALWKDMEHAYWVKFGTGF